MKTAFRTDTFSLGATSNGAAFPLASMEGFSVAGNIVTSDAVGTIKLQASNNAIPDNPTGVENPNATWEDISGATEVLASANATMLINVADVYYNAFRIVYTRSSGTGTATFYIWAKGVM